MAIILYFIIRSEILILQSEYIVLDILSQIVGMGSNPICIYSIQSEYNISIISFENVSIPLVIPLYLAMIKNNEILY